MADYSHGEYSRLLMCRKSGIQLGLALAAGPWATWRTGKLTGQSASLAQEGEIRLKRELSRIFAEAERRSPDRYTVAHIQF
jgi:hypothetical protein